MYKNLRFHEEFLKKLKICKKVKKIDELCIKLIKKGLILRIEDANIVEFCWICKNCSSISKNTVEKAYC